MKTSNFLWFAAAAYQTSDLSISNCISYSFCCGQYKEELAKSDQYVWTVPVHPYVNSKFYSDQFFEISFCNIHIFSWEY